jgi:DNA polymerase III sliding clamp (beta) subunit (PCNA family)
MTVMGESISSITLLAHSAMDMQADTFSAAWLQKNLRPAARVPQNRKEINVRPNNNVRNSAPNTVTNHREMNFNANRGTTSNVNRGTAPNVNERMNRNTNQNAGVRKEAGRTSASRSYTLTRSNSNLRSSSRSSSTRNTSAPSAPARSSQGQAHGGRR